MRKHIDENPTRQKIIMLLNKAEHLTVAELSKDMEITPMAVRQHLMALERKGIISYVSRKYGIGRPVFLYSLTEKAKAAFPKAYSSFLRDMLRVLADIDGPGKIEIIFERRRDRMVKQYGTILSKARTVSEKVQTLARQLDSEGYMIETEEKGGKIVIKQFNCMLTDVAVDYPQSCTYELKMYQELFGKDVQRIECQRDGAPSCTYVIPKS
jgi:predicted ArsR family transcriptional regulator